MKNLKFYKTYAAILLVAALFVSTSQVQAVGDLITHWKFDEAAPGSVAADSSGSGFDGTPHGMNNNVADPALQPQPSTDVPPTTFTNSHSAFFQGDGGTVTGSYYDVSNWNVDTSNGFTVSLWAKPLGGGAWERFFDFGNGPGDDNIVFAQYDTTDSVYFEVYNGTATTKIIAPAGSWIYGSWHYYAATIDASGNATIYIDGNPVVSGTTNKPLNIPRTSKYIGKSNWSDSYYEGYMDDMRVYSRALTQAELQDITNGNPGPGVAMPNPTPAPPAPVDSPVQAAASASATLVDTGANTVLTSAMAGILLVTSILVYVIGRKKVHSKA